MVNAIPIIALFLRFPLLVPEEMQQRAVDTASAALEQYNVEKDIAMHIKKEFDRLYGTTWHVIVGKK